MVIMADDLIGEKEKSRLLTEEMEATLQDIQNMYLELLKDFQAHNHISYLLSTVYEWVGKR